MTGYDAIEAAVVDRMVAHFSPDLTADTCKSADIDSVYANILSSDSNFGCVLDFGGADRDHNAPFNQAAWVWDVVGLFLVRYRDVDNSGVAVDPDKNVRKIISMLPRLFETDPRLGGKAISARVAHIDQPDPSLVNDASFYIFTFIIEVVDK